MKLIRIENAGDDRGSSFSLGGLVGEWIQHPADCHAADIEPGFVRGNHYHTKRREVIVVRYDSGWSLFWDEGAGTKVRSTTVCGSGVVVIHVIPDCSHAIANTGENRIFAIAISDRTYDGASDETRRRVIVSTDQSGQLTSTRRSQVSSRNST